MTFRNIALGLIVIALVFAIVGCSPITQGKIVEKIHEPERTWVQLVPLKVGKITVLTPITHVDDEDWIFKIQNENGDTGIIYVSKSIFDDYNVGDHYSADANDELEDTIEQREE